MKTINLRIYSNGKVQAETQGIKGKACLNYISIIEQLTGARTEDSEYTKEYYDPEELLEDFVDQEVQI